MTLDRASGTRLAASTAEGAAALRAAGAVERDPRVRGPDDLAARFVSAGPRLSAVVKVPLLRRVAPPLAERILPGSYWFEIARVRHMDSVLHAELAAGVPQVVILGAGFDTRAHRFSDRLGHGLVYEVDHPLTAACKRERVRRVFGSLPGHVRYVEADLEAGDLGSRLERAGHRSDLPSAVVWSGVTPYLSGRAVESVLSWLAARNAARTSVVFDYVFREALAGDTFYYGAAQLLRRVKAVGEPLRFGLPCGGAARFLARWGLELVSDLGPEELERRYLVRGERLAGRPYGFVAIAHARLPPL